MARRTKRDGFTVSVRDNRTGESISFSVRPAYGGLTNIAEVLNAEARRRWLATTDINSRRHKRR